MRKIILALLFVTVLISVTSCTSSATPEYVPEGAERESVLANTDQIMQDLLTAIQTKDTDLFSKYFSEEMLAAMKAADQEKLFKQLEPLGESQEVELINVQDLKENYAVRYKVTYGEKVLIYRLVVSKADSSVLEGLWLE
jgi:hypothetical protein